MFCPSCGSEVREGLRFCNHCGAQIVADKTAPPHLLGLIWLFVIATVIVAIVGFFVIFMFGRESVERGNILGSTLLLLLVLTISVLVILTLMIRQTSRLLTAYLLQGDFPQQAQKGKLTQQRSAMLNEPQQSPAQLDSIHATNPTNLAQQTTRVLQTNEEQQTRKFETNE